MTRSRPIVFSAPMVQAILAGRKTCTRRLVDITLDDTWTFPMPEPGTRTWFIKRAEQDVMGVSVGPCPFGIVGDQLWVKEAWNALYPQPNDIPWYHHELGAEKAKQALADGVKATPIYRASQGDPNYPTPDDVQLGFKWQSPRFMPRWASRLTLEITGVGLERLHAVTSGDALDEGVTILPDEWVAKHWPDYVRERDRVHAHNAQLNEQGQFLDLTRPPLGPSPRDRFQAYWQDLHGADAWARNPWVWRVEFKQVNA